MTPANRASARSPLKRVLLSQRALYAQAGRLSFVTGLMMLVPAWFMFEVYGRVLNSRNVNTLWWLVVMVVGVYIVLELLEIVRSRVLYRAAQAIDEQLRERAFDVTFAASLRRIPGGTSQVFADLRTLRDFIPSPAVTAALDTPAASVSLVLLFAMSPWLGLLAMIGALLQVGLAMITERRTLPLLTDATRASIDAQNYASGTLRNAQVIESMGMLGQIHQRWLSRQQRFLARQSAASDHGGFTSVAAKLIQTMQGSLLLGFAAWLSLHHSLAGGAAMIIVASILGGRVLAPLAQLVAQWRLVVGARDAYGRLDALLTAIVPPEAGMPLPAPKGLLTVEGLVASAPGSQQVILKGVSFAAQPGQVLLVIGPSAAGKSTLARLLVGVWPASGGNVRLDGADVFAWNKDELGPHMGYLPQGVELFDGTVAENISRFGKVDMNLVREAADQVGITDAVMQLPEGFDTRIGDEGAVLSGGQRQRVGLARAIYGNPRLLVLDEPNSSLDETGEKALLALLHDQKIKGNTVVAITHRTTLMPAADRLLVLNDGQTAMFGPRDDVLAALKKANEQAREQQLQRQAAMRTATALPGGTA